MAMCHAGLAVIPCGGVDGKRPLVQRWSGRKRRGGPGGIERYLRRARFRAADVNVAVLTWLSGVTVVDVDGDAGLLAAMIERFGDTPLKVRSASGGHHLYYRSGGERSIDLRDTEGLPVEVRGAGNIVVAPPSRNPLTGRAYEFLSGSWADLPNLPRLRPGSLNLANSAGSAGTTRSPRSAHPKPNADPVPLRAVRRGRRNNTLFRLLLRQAPYCDTEADLLDLAEDINGDFDPSLPHDEVVKTALSAWSYEQRGENWAGRPGRVTLTGPEIDALRPYPDASHLFLILRRAHGARREPFAASPKAMARERVIPGWQHGRYRAALGRLVDLGLLRVVHRGGRKCGDPRLYTLAALVLAKGPVTGPNITKHLPLLSSLPFPAAGGMRLTGMTIRIVLPPPAQPDLFEAGSPAIDGADLGGWSRGLAPPSVIMGLRYELRRRGLRQDDLARRVGISRSQLGNGLRGRFGLGPTAVAGLKAFLVEATAA